MINRSRPGGELAVQGYQILRNAENQDTICRSWTNIIIIWLFRVGTDDFIRKKGFSCPACEEV